MEDRATECFVHVDSWFDRKYQSLCGTRWPTLKAALNLWLQSGGQTIVETGSIRQQNEFTSGCSTVIFAEVAARHGGFLWSVDNNPQHNATALELTVDYAPYRCCVLGDSVEFLLAGLPSQAGVPGHIDLLYLDSLDYPMNEIMARFGCRSDAELRDLVSDMSVDDFATGHADLVEPSQQHCLAELHAAMPLLHSRSIVLIDDNSCPGGGKPRLAKRLLSALGWNCVLDSQQTLWLHPGWRRFGQV